MKKIGVIIGILLLLTAVVIGTVMDFPGDSVAVLAIAGFSTAILFIQTINVAKEKGNYSIWTIVFGICATGGGVLCAFTGLTENTMGLIISSIVAVVSVILAVLTDKRVIPKM
jgi:hypothetical protein